MKVIYTAENRLLVGNAQNLLEQAGISVFLKNEHAASGVGELSAIDSWPELWVDEADFSKAKAVIEPLFSDEVLASWQCEECGEENEASFEVCWQCQHNKP
ncbi:Putative signal transducing protein [Alteromonadaceae bacterium Bs31]|nr:Putative signal transducing protein [Alteromonadaceae bacterium Bs31]